MINTVFRLVILIPAALVCSFAALTILEAGGMGVGPAVVSAAIAAAAVALIAWTIADHRKRAHAKDDLNA